MENSELSNENRIFGKDLIKYFILIYWTLFWLLNVTDKIIGGAHFLFVGKDRFAQVERFFDSLGLGSPIIANIALTVTAAFEIFAFVFFAGALVYFIKKNTEVARSWFFIGIIFTLTTFIYFSIGDQIFGDHFELLEHALFLLSTLLSWIIYIHIDKIHLFDNFSIVKKQFFGAATFAILIALIAIYSICSHNQNSFVERTQAVNAIKISNNKYKIKFPFLAGSKAFENSIAKFKVDNPNLKINYIYTAPTPLRLAESDGLIIYIQTDEK